MTNTKFNLLMKDNWNAKDFQTANTLEEREVIETTACECVTCKSKNIERLGTNYTTRKAMYWCKDCFEHFEK